ncbi:hypothetical protein EBB07_27755 [Paenibacillaceae bacterium]|nr:hypothetical protein EBB07_27755 [Paenibacillaceae bacterium]
MDFQTKIALLKQFEKPCFQICAYLVGDHSVACQTAEQVLTELFATPRFWDGDEEVRKGILKRIATRHSLQQMSVAG